MLVLSRARDERIIIEIPREGKPPEHIELSIVDIRGDRVRVGIEASPAVKVDRKEVYESKKLGPFHRPA